MKSCLAGADEQALLSIYKAAAKEKLATGTFTSSSHLKFNERAMTMFRFIKLFALKNCPISCVSDDDLRDLSENNVRIKETMLKLVEIFEAKIEAEMQQAKGAIIYNGWTYSSMRYMAEFAVYMRELSAYRSGMLFKENALACPVRLLRRTTSRAHL